MSAAERASEASSAEQANDSAGMRERCERMSEWTSEWPSTLCVDFISFLPNDNVGWARRMSLEIKSK